MNDAVTSSIDTATLTAISATIIRATGRSFRVRSTEPVPGGQLPLSSKAHSSFILGDGGQRYFVKLTPSRYSRVLDAQRDGLQALRAASARVPQTVAFGIHGEHAYLVLEHLTLATPQETSFVGLAAMLATLHSHPSRQFGWSRANFIGLAEQPNPNLRSWIDFWRDARIAPQLARAAQNGHGGLLISLGERVIDALPKILGSHQPQPVLVHGDLRHGNIGFLANGAPVMLEPAVYWGDREVDLALSELYGGFPPEFYAAYHERAPLDAGYPLRRNLYNLYHLLNQLNRFGGPHREQAQIAIRGLLAQVS